jgi:dihydrofolate reductase
MKTFLISALTADGFIARNSNHFPDWTAPEDTKLFVDLTKEAGTIVMGSKTFLALQAQGRRLPKRQIIVYTNHPEMISGDRVETTNEDPAALVARLRTEGSAGLAICGGSAINTAFLKAGVVEDLYLSIEPLFFGTGIPLFSEQLDVRLKLLKSVALNENTILLHYNILQKA